MEQKLSDTLVKAIDRSNPFMQNLQLASRFNKLIDESADLDNNKEATIDVSAYTEPVEIEPTEGKDGMKKVTVALDNIPSGSATAYAWINQDANYVYFNFDVAPESKEELLAGMILYPSGYQQFYVERNSDYLGDGEFIRTDDNEFGYNVQTYTRAPTKDVTLWQVSEIGG